MKKPKEELLAGEITRLLGEIHGGSREAMDKLFELVYKELREMAGRKFRGERKNHTLPTAEKDWQAARARLHGRLEGEGHEA